LGELQRLLPGISEKMLIQDLRQMQESNLLVREAGRWITVHDRDRGRPGERLSPQRSRALRRRRQTVQTLFLLE
jgi:hypothetical protein